jgi:BA14K-like protein
MLTFKKGLAVAALALTLPMVGVSASNAAPLAPSTGIAATSSAAASHDLTDVYYRRWGGGGWGYRRGGWGWGGAAAGLAAGAIIGGAIAANSAPYYGYGYGPGYYPAPGYAVAPGYVEGGGGDAVAYCMQRYRSYDPRSGTYLNNDGNRYPCP